MNMQLNPEIANILEPAYAPCAAFCGPCTEMRWDPSRGHVPRGFRGASGALEEIELVLVFAEPGDPHPSETHTGLSSTYEYSTSTVANGTDLFHRNIKSILNSCWPRLTYEEQLRKVWMTESVLCSALIEGGNVASRVSHECGKRYLLPQLSLLPHALVVALGSKAQKRMRAIGYTKFLPAYAVAPPGCNFRRAKESWNRIPIELRLGKEPNRVRDGN